MSAAGQGQDSLLPERLNHLITKLERGEIVVGGNVGAGSRAGAPSTWDFVWIDMEHTGFDLPGLEITLQFLLNRRQILEQGTLAPPGIPRYHTPLENAGAQLTLTDYEDATEAGGTRAR